MSDTCRYLYNNNDNNIINISPLICSHLFHTQPADVTISSQKVYQATL